MNMNTSKVILDSIELSNLLNKIELQIKNIEIGDTHAEINNLMNFPCKSNALTSNLREETMKELHEMLYNAFVLICRISLATSDENLLSVVDKSCSRIITLLSSSQLKIQKVPKVKPLADLYNKTILYLQQNSKGSMSSNIENLSTALFLEIL